MFLISLLFSYNQHALNYLFQAQEQLREMPVYNEDDRIKGTILLSYLIINWLALQSPNHLPKAVLEIFIF